MYGEESTNCPNCGTLIRDDSDDYKDNLYMCPECGQIFCGPCSYDCPNCGNYRTVMERLSVNNVNYLKERGKIVGGRNKDQLEKIARNARFEMEMKERAKKAQERAMQESNRRLNE